ncbi:response regulator FixJ [Methylocella sp.]|uniref:response regulator FixJ n=1 Tax=Methylocella sp. TaxID=1978226 RepID=UPI00378524D1
MSDAVVHLIDDDDAVRQALGFLLMASGFAVRAYESAAGFVERLGSAQAGCVVTDVRMPGVDGLELLRILKARRARLPVVVMTGHGDVALAVEAMKAGAVDFLEKPFDDQRFLAAVRLALDRQAHDARRDEEAAAIQLRLDALSAREREVLDGLVAGQPNKTIAYDLNISPRTVEAHRANVMAKMGAANLSDLLRMALAARQAAGE